MHIDVWLRRWGRFSRGAARRLGYTRRAVYPGRAFPKRDRSGRFVVLASGFAEDEGALPVRADARVSSAMLNSCERVRHASLADGCAYLVVESARIEIDGEMVGPLDGVAITSVAAREISALEDSELVLVETAGCATF